VASEVHSRSADLSKLTLISFTDSNKQVQLHFIRDQVCTSSSDTRTSKVAIDLHGSTEANSETVVF
jgi:hypothetical protein